MYVDRGGILCRVWIQFVRLVCLFVIPCVCLCVCAFVCVCLSFCQFICRPVFARLPVGLHVCLPSVCVKPPPPSLSPICLFPILS